MDQARPLPSYLIQRFQGWRATTYQDNKAWYRRLAEAGQMPRAMIISCCDSRVHVTSIFGADEGEFFIHRNIANLVPPFNPDGQYHGTSAAVEYAVTALRVAHIVVLGHSNCGGVKGCHDMCLGHAPELEAQSSFVGRWMDILRPGFERTAPLAGDPARVRAMAATVASPTSYHSLCILCSARVSLRTGWKVPAPTCSVICARPTPSAASAASTASSKCSDAVGAATAPGRWANTVW